MATAKQRAWRAKFAKLYGGKKKARRHSVVKTTPKTRRSRRVYVMARKRRYGRRSGGKKLFGLGTKGLIGGLGLMGVVAGVMFKDQIAAMIPVNLPMKDKMVAFALGGPAGAVLAFGKDYLMPTNGGTTSGQLF